MEKNVQIVVVGEDEGLPMEFEAALQGITSRHCVTTYATDYRRAGELSVNRQPHLICVDMDSDFNGLKQFAQEIHQMHPETIVAAMYRPGQIDSESSVVIEAIRSNVHDFLRHPLSSTELRQLLDRLESPCSAKPSVLGEIVSFMGNKGGVGKSTLAVNVASLLASSHPGRVLLIDASVQFGVCTVMLDITSSTSLIDAVREKGRLDETMLRQLTIGHQSGLHVLAAPSDAVEGAEVDGESMYRILNLARRAFDYVIIDTFPILDNIALSVLDLSDLVYLVMQGTAPNVIATSKLLPILQNLGIPKEKQRLVLNQNYPSFTGNLSPSDIEERLLRQFDHVFPYEKKLIAAANSGEPYSLGRSHRFGFLRSLQHLCSEIEGLTTLGEGELCKSPSDSSFQQVTELVGGWWRG